MKLKFCIVWLLNCKKQQLKLIYNKLYNTQVTCVSATCRALDLESLLVWCVWPELAKHLPEFYAVIHFKISAPWNMQLVSWINDDHVISMSPAPKFRFVPPCSYHLRHSGKEDFTLSRNISSQGAITCKGKRISWLSCVYAFPCSSAPSRGLSEGQKLPWWSMMCDTSETFICIWNWY